MSATTVQFVEMVRAEHARIERLKQAAVERGEIIENITVSFLNGEIDEQTRDELLDIICGQEPE